MEFPIISWSSIFVFIAGLFIAFAQVRYIIDTFKRKVKPSLLSWLGWAMLMGTSLISVCISEGWNQSLTGLLISTLGCLTVAILSFVIKNYSLQKVDWNFLLAGGCCMILYLSTNNPWATTLFAIAADFALAIPTFIKASKNAGSEKSTSWIFGFISWAITLLISLQQDIIYILWPLYLFGFNATMLYLSYFRK